MNTLAHLSLQRVTGYRQPYAPNNEQRIKALRPYLPVQFANARFAFSPGERYAREQSPQEPITHYADRRG